MRIAICDDDEWELQRLSELIAKYHVSRGESCEQRSFYSGADLLADIKGGEYDLVLIDMLMPGISGIQVVQELRELDKNVRIIFVSSSPQFAVESYRLDAYYYLLKPVDSDSLFPLLDKVANELSMQEEQAIVLKNRDGVVRVFFTELEYVEVINKKVFFHLSSGVIYEVTATLADFEGMLLLRPEFIKTHRSYLVNLSYVQAVKTHYVVTKSGHSVPVSRKRHRQIQNAYMCFLHQTDDDRPDRQEEGTSAAQECPDSPWRILLVDDNPDDCTIWADILRSHGCGVVLAQNGEEALRLAAEERCDCVLLDVMLPGEDGFSVCEKLRRTIRTPIIFLSCLTESDSQVEGFAAGGIDYITKDTPAELFWAKVETRVKMFRENYGRTKFSYGPLLLDLKGRRVLMNGKELLLTPIEFDILWQLSERTEHIFTPQEIFDMIWSGQPWDGGQMVQMHMSRLRRKLEKAYEEHQFVETVWGQGYRFVPTDN